MSLICPPIGPEYYALTTQEREDCINPGSLFMWALLLFAAGISLFVSGLRTVRKKRMIENTPRAKARSVPMGRVEVQGIIRNFEETTMAPFSNTPCVYIRFSIEEERESTDKDGKTRRSWHLLHNGHHSVPFFVEDETGRVLVHAKGAEIDTKHDRRHVSITWAEVPQNIVSHIKKVPKGPIRFSETYLAPGDQLYVLGYAGDNPYVKSASSDDSTANTMIQQKNRFPFFITDTSEEIYIKNLGTKGPFYIVSGAALALFSLLAAILINRNFMNV